MHEKGEHMSKDDLLLLIQAVRAEDRDKQEMKAMLKDILERLVRIEARLERPVWRRAPNAPAPYAKLNGAEEVMKKTGLSRATLYKLIKQGDFPAGSRPPGRKYTQWASDDVDAWVEQSS
jgi:predicted DNA-binding transcriptional regulator AlpA